MHILLFSRNSYFQYGSTAWLEEFENLDWERYLSHSEEERNDTAI